MNFLDGVGNEQIFEYYTLVNGETAYVPVQQQLLMSNNAVEEEETETTTTWKPFYFVTLTQAEQAEQLDVEEDEEEITQVDHSSNSETPFLSNLRLITLEDGRMFVTSDSSGNNNN